MSPGRWGLEPWDCCSLGLCDWYDTAEDTAATHGMKPLQGKGEESGLGSGEKRPKHRGKHLLSGKRALALVIDDCHSKHRVSGQILCLQMYRAAAGSRNPGTPTLEAAEL